MREYLNQISQKKVSNDQITVIAAKARQFREKNGLESLIDGTIGMFYSEDEQLYVFETIKKIVENSSLPRYFSYAPMISDRQFKEGMLNLARINELSDKIAVVPTSGGLGAIHHSVHNFCDAGTLILSLDPFWGPYQNIIEETGLSLHGIKPLKIGEQLIDPANIADQIIKLLEEKEQAEKYNKIFFLLNTPAGNPTGLSLSNEEIKQLKANLEIIRDRYSVNIIIYLDTAYIDYTDYSLKELISEFKTTGLLLIGYSLSKTAGIYGMRTGCIMLYSEDRQEQNEFMEKMGYSSRASTGSINHLGYQIVRAFSDKKKAGALADEHNQVKKILKKRKEEFIKILNEKKYLYYRHDDGFFVTFRPEDRDSKEKILQYYKELEEDGVFFVPSPDGLRVALCSIPHRKVVLLGEKI